MSELAVYTDPFRLKQILVNLLGNAVKFTEEGEIVLGIEDNPEGIKFYVKDSGIGIREEKQKVIFDRFMQGHETKTKLYGGTGLGLAISKNLTEILGGEIGLESESGEGSTFWFELPFDIMPQREQELSSNRLLLLCSEECASIIRPSLKDWSIEFGWFI